MGEDCWDKPPGGRGYSHFYAYVGSGPASTLQPPPPPPPEKYQEFQATQKYLKF